MMRRMSAPKPGMRMAADITRKKMGSGYARGGSVNEKLHPGHEPGGLDVGSMVTAILRRRTGSQAPQLMAEGGDVDDRAAQRAQERLRLKQEFINENATGGPPSGPSGSMDERVRRREVERNQEDEAMGQSLAFGGQVDGDDDAAVRQSDFLALEGTDGMGKFDHDPMSPEAGKLRRRRILGEIMDDLAAEHYGRS